MLLKSSSSSWIDVRVLRVILLHLNNRSVLNSAVSTLIVRSWMEMFSNSAIQLKTVCPCELSEGDPFLYSPSNSLNRDSWRRLVTPVRDSPTLEGSLVLTCPSWLLILARDGLLYLKEEVERHVSVLLLPLLEPPAITASRVI